MYPQAISKKTKSVLEKIIEAQIPSGFYLAGGTGLSVQLGHRESIDLDFFSETDFSVSKLKNALAAIGMLEVDYEEKGTLSGTFDGVKISFFHYGYEQLFPLADYEGICLADERDIAAMKIDTISSRGSKKDFVDVYFLLKKYSLTQLLVFFENKYKNIKYNKLHILKSLVYFDDAENDPDPLMFNSFDWNEAKNEIEKEVGKIAGK